MSACRSHQTKYTEVHVSPLIDFTEYQHLNLMRLNLKRFFQESVKINEPPRSWNSEQYLHLHICGIRDLFSCTVRFFRTWIANNYSKHTRTRCRWIRFGVVFWCIEHMTIFAGGFYSDDIGYVGESCKKCPNGSVVPFNKTPGTSKQDCKSCPEGSNRNIFINASAWFSTFRLLLPKISKISLLISLEKSIFWYFTGISQQMALFRSLLSCARMFSSSSVQQVEQTEEGKYSHPFKYSCISKGTNFLCWNFQLFLNLSRKFSWLKFYFYVN